MAFSDFQDSAGYLVAVQRTQYIGGRDWQAGFDNLRDNITGPIGSEFKRTQDAIHPTLANAKEWNNRLRSGLIPLLEYAMVEIGESYGTPDEMMARLVEYCVTNGIYVAGRVVGYGADPADGTVGIHRRITVNRHGERIETGDHDIPDGIKIKVVESEATGSSNAIPVEYSSANASNERKNSLRTSGFTRKTQATLVGPRNTGLATNALLQGNDDESDGADITDGDASSGGISGWDQTRTGTPTVKARPNDAWGDQPYGIGIGKASATFKIEQSYQGWDLEDGVPVAGAFPMKQSGAAWEGDITWALGGISGTWDETDLTNGSYEVLITDLDENAYPDNYDDTDDKTSLTFAMDAFTDGGEEVILGGVYWMKGFQLQPGGEWHFCWEPETEPTLYTEVSFSADTQTDDGELQDAFCRAFPNGPSLPVSGSSLWSPFAGPTITTSSPLPGGSNGVAYSQSLASTGGITPYVYSLIDGALPSGITLDDDGTISGTHVGTGTFDFVVEVRDAIGKTDAMTFELTIS